MEIKPIRTKKDYASALKEIERLFDAAPGTREGDRLEVLATLVEAYEEKHHPIVPPNPIDVTRYYMESRVLTRVAWSFLPPLLFSLPWLSDIILL